MSDVNPPYPPPPPPYGASSLEQRPGNGLAVAALVLGIVSLVLFCVWYVSLPCSILAIIFGKIGRGRAREGASGGGMATAGMVCGVIALCIAILIIGCAVAGVSLVGTQFFEEMQRMAEQAQQAGQGTATMPASPSAP